MNEATLSITSPFFKLTSQHSCSWSTLFYSSSCCLPDIPLFPLAPRPVCVYVLPCTPASKASVCVCSPLHPGQLGLCVCMFSLAPRPARPVCVYVPPCTPASKASVCVCSPLHPGQQGQCVCVCMCTVHACVHVPYSLEITPPLFAG